VFQNELREEMLFALKICQRFLARNQPMVKSDVPIFGEVADQFDAVRGFVRTIIENVEKVRQAEGLEPLELTEEKYQGVITHVSK
jgi:hypothetical protein